jgi:undecaprenyl-diphosphatase
MRATPLSPGQFRTQDGHRVGAPLLVRHPWLGYAIALVALLAFALLAWQVALPNPRLQAWDVSSARSIYDWAKQQSDPVVLFMRFWSAYGRDGTALIALILAVVWTRRHQRRLLWLLFFGLLGSELWFQALSQLIDRARPEYKDPFETLIGAGFPSGHMTTNVILGGMILYLLLPRIRSRRNRVLLTVAVITVILLIGISRLFLGLHYPTDMVGGLLLGLGWGAFILTLTENYFYRRDA